MFPNHCDVWKATKMHQFPLQQHPPVVPIGRSGKNACNADWS